MENGQFVCSEIVDFNVFAYQNLFTLQSDYILPAKQLTKCYTINSQ